MARVVCSVWIAIWLLGCEEPQCIRHSQCNNGYECRDSRCQKIATDAGVKMDGGKAGAGGKGGLVNATRDASTKPASGGTSGNSTATSDAAMTDTTDNTDNSSGASGTM